MLYFKVNISLLTETTVLWIDFKEIWRVAMPISLKPCSACHRVMLWRAVCIFIQVAQSESSG